MKRERNQHIDEVFQAALARAPADRTAFLDEACSDDIALRLEVEALLASDEQAGGFIESPALEIAPEMIAEEPDSSVTGKFIGPYRIDARLGSGGMGEVYLAHDQRLGRRVALKLLDTALGGESEVRTRFQREARLASALDHPNICTVHEVGEAGGRLFIAMQYVEGETVRRIVRGRPLKLDSLLSISLQVADALSEAHKQGIIHRDIKPGNVMVTPRGQAKVLDFGLAKLLERSKGETDTQLTMTGAVMGTPAAMSPEQARGERVDHRSDIFSFGVVMYEMATGEIPFNGKSRAEVLSALLKDPHTPASQLNKDLPERLSQVIDRALAKNPAQRYQSMDEMIAELRRVVAEAGGLDHLFRSSGARLGVTTPYVPPRRHGMLGGLRRLAENRFVIASLAAGAAIIVVGLMAASYWLRSSERHSPPRQRLISTFAGSHRAASFSPDGNMIAFVNAADGVSQVWVKNLSQGEAVQITFAEDPAERPRWSPRGDRIVYVRRSQRTHDIWSVSPQGGEPRKLIEGGRNPNWSWDGGRLVFERGYAIWTADAEGGDQRKVEGIPPTDLLLADRMPALAPDGSLIAFFQKAKGPIGDYWVIPTAGGKARRLTSDDSLGGAPTWTPDGRFVMVPSQRAGSMTLWKVPVAGGEPLPVLLSAGEDTDPEVSRDGRRLIYTNTRKSFTLTLTDPSSGQHRDLYQSRTPLVDPSFSLQGDKIVFFGFAEGGGVHLYTVNVEGGNLTQLTRGKEQQNIHPQWSADGSAVYFYQQRPATAFHKLSLRDGGLTELIQGWEWATHYDSRVDPEGRRLVYTRMDQGNPVATMIRDLETGKETAFRLLMRGPRWSRDGKFIVGVDQSSGSAGDITICPFDAGPCRKLAPGYRPHLSSDGSHVYFYRASELRDGEQLWFMTREGKDEKHIADLRPLDPIGGFFDVSPTGQVVWVRYYGGKQELWLSDFPES